MIVNSVEDLDDLVELLKSINKEILGYSNIIKPELLESVFSASPYIDDIKLDIVTIVYNILKDHIFGDGNKRTALVMLVGLSNEFNLTIKVNDFDLENLILKLTSDEISKDEFITKLY